MLGPSRLALLTAVSLALALASACNGDRPAPTDPTPTSPVPATGLPGATPSPTQPAAGATATPALRVGNEPVGFQTDDGVILRGHLYEPTGPRRKVVILAHAAGNDQNAWTSFAQDLAQRGIAALTFDFRGYGESEGPRNLASIDRDLEAAVRFMRARDFPQVYVIGEEIGGTAALKVAARQDLAGVVTVSARVTHMGLDAAQDLASISERKLFLAAQGDAQGAQAVAALMGATPDPKDSQLFAGGGVGVTLLQGALASEVAARIFQFIDP